MHGLKDFGKDSQWLIQTKVNADQYRLVSWHQNRKERNVREDFIKMIPFSFFLIVPGAELLLPVWLQIFPNSLPSQFISEEDHAKNYEARKVRQKEAAEKLLFVYPLYLKKLTKEPELDPQDAQQLKELMAKIKNKSTLPTDLL